MPERIRNNPRAATLLADVFDFDVTRLDAMRAAFEPEIDERRAEVAAELGLAAVHGDEFDRL